jgi:two-component system, NarL family, response regulator NreC
MIEVLLAVPYAILADAMQVTLDRESNIEVIAKTKTGEETLDLLNELQPTIVILDINGYRFGSMQVLLKLREEQPHIPVLVIGPVDPWFDSKRILQTGAVGYLSKLELPERLVGMVSDIAARINPPIPTSGLL